MRRTHYLSDALFEVIYKAITTRQYWLAFPAGADYLCAGDLRCFSSREEARDYEADRKEGTPATRIIYAPSVLSAYQQIEGYGRHPVNDFITTKNSTVMNEKNLDYLKDSLKYLGFGEGLAEKLREQMGKGAPDFQLTFETEINKKAFAAVLNFRKSETADLYFVNSYHATLQRSNGEIFDQAFYLNKGKGVTAKEAYNLLEGRAVYKELETKEGQKYGAWIQLDFEKRDKNNNHEVRQFHDAYGYDLKASLEKFNLQELKAPDLADTLVQSLKKGNLQAVTVEKDGGTVRMFVEANPQYKTVNLYDGGFHRVPKEALEQYFVAGISAEKKQNASLEGPGKGREKINGKEVPRQELANENEKTKGAKKSKALDSALIKGNAKGVKDLLPQRKEGQAKKGLNLG